MRKIKNSRQFLEALNAYTGGNKSKVGDVINSALFKSVKNTTEPRMTMYTSEIQPFMYPDNSFVSYSQNDAAFAASGEIKKLQASVVGPTVTKGRFYSKSLVNGDNAPEKTVKVRKNNSFDWEMEYFHTDPDSLTFELTSEVPYEARQELLKAHADILNLNTANFTAVEWAHGDVGVAETINTVDDTTNRFVFTTGTNRPTSVVGGTGNVKKITKEDMINLRSTLNKQQNSDQSRAYMLPTPEQLDDLRAISDFNDYDKRGIRDIVGTGVIGEIYRILILDPRFREDWGANVLYGYTTLVGDDTDLTKIEDTASSGANQASAALVWFEDKVLRAQGTPIVFPWMNSPIYLGDVYAVETRYSARQKRNDGKGVVMLIDNPFTA